MLLVSVEELESTDNLKISDTFDGIVKAAAVS